MSSARGRSGARGRTNPPRTDVRQPGAQGSQAPRSSAWGPPAAAAGPSQQQYAPSSHASGGSGTASSSSQSGFAAGPGGSGGNGNGGNGNGNGSQGRGTFRGQRRLQTATDHYQVMSVRTRPENVVRKQGTGGTPITLTANYFEVLTKPEWAIYQYRVDINPDEDRTFVRKAMVYRQKARLGGYLFDGTMLFCAHRLNPDPMELVDRYTPKGGEEKTSRITIRLVQELVKGDYHYIQVFNILMRRCYETLDMKLMNRDYFDPRAKIDIRDWRLELWPGYKTTIRQHEDKILMCAEVTHKVLRTDTVLDLIADLTGRGGGGGGRGGYGGGGRGGGGRGGYGGDWKTEFKRAVIGSIVMTQYNAKTYLVSDVAFDQTPQTTFDMKGKKVSYAEYMKQKYDVTVRDMGQPMLISKPKAREVRSGQDTDIALIPELCQMTGLSDDMRANFRLMSALATHTRVAPEPRQRALVNFINRLRGNTECSNMLSSWNMSLSNQLVTINARRYADEKIFLNPRMEARPGKDCDWTHLVQKSQYSSAQLRKWLLISPQREQGNAQRYLQALQRVGRDMGFPIPEPQWSYLPSDRAADWARQLSQELDRDSFDMVMCVVVGKKADVYSAIKKVCYLDRAVPNQVVTNKLCEKASLSTATKVAIQMNAKLGGIPWTVHNPLKKLMVVGYDACHDTANKGLSYGAMVATLDDNMGRYFSAVAGHQNGEELSNQLATNIHMAVKKYAEYNKTLPERIIIYRDGVGEGQVPYVKDHELEEIKKTLDQVYCGSGEYKLSFIIVTKRLNTRLFNGKLNPMPGTVADDVITDPMKYDFFLVSQTVRQGTVAPTSYNVIENGVALPPERLQMLTYKLTHLYYNCSYTMSVPAVCQLAHKLAFLVGQSLHRAPADILQTSLYYL